MLQGLSGLLLTVVGIVASIFALSSDELNKKPKLKYAIMVGLGSITLLAGLMSFYGFVQDNSEVNTPTPPPTNIQTIIPTSEGINVVEEDKIILSEDFEDEITAY